MSASGELCANGEMSASGELCANGEIDECQWGMSSSWETHLTIVLQVAFLSIVVFAEFPTSHFLLRCTGICHISHTFHMSHIYST